MAPRSPIRLLHIISGDLWAGAESMAYQLLSGLNRLAGIDLHLIILNKGRLESSCRQAGIKCHLIDEKKVPFSNIAFTAIRIAGRIKPHIIHSHRYKENILAALVSFFSGPSKLVATQHGRTESDKDRFPKNFTGKLNHAFLRGNFSKVVAVSNDTAAYLQQECGLKKKGVTVISNGITLPSMTRPVKKNGDSRPFTVGSAGRLFPVKRFDTFIEIARKVCHVRPEVRFLIAGGGPERQKLEALIRRYGLQKKIRLLGHLDDIQAFYSKLDLYINTSAHEGAPMTILEAMATGLPVMVFDVAGLKEMIVDGCEGFIIPEGQNDLFASRIVELTKHPEQLNVLGTRARRKIAARYSETKMVKDYQAFYARICAK